MLQIGLNLHSWKCQEFKHIKQQMLTLVYHYLQCKRKYCPHCLISLKVQSNLSATFGLYRCELWRASTPILGASASLLPKRGTLSGPWT